MITIYTDGSCIGNPGRGGYGVVLLYGNHRKELSQGFRHTTNNRMELLAAIVGLESLKNEGQQVTIYSDAKYLVDTIEKKWIVRWQKKGYKKTKNVDLWRRLWALYNKHSVKFIWVKGHSTTVENNRCDILAFTAATSSNLLPDHGYEEEVKETSNQFSFW